MKKGLEKLVIHVLNSNIKTEANNKCFMFGYQPKMPDSVRKFSKVTKK